MRVINKQNLYPIFFLSAILILVLFFSGFSFQEGLTTTTNTPVVNAVVTTPTTTTPAPVPVPAPTTSSPATVPIQVSPATAAIVSGALDTIVQMGFSAVKTTNTMVKQMDAEVKKVEANATTPTPVVPNSTSSPTTWVPTPITSTSQ